MIINAGRRQEDTSWMRLQLSAKHIKLTTQDKLCILAVQGPEALERLNPLLDQDIHQLKPFRCLIDKDTMIARTGYTGERGEIILPETEAIVLAIVR